MSEFFRKKLHKITLLLTAVFWANCGAAEETLDVAENSSKTVELPDSLKLLSLADDKDSVKKESFKDSVKKAERGIVLSECYYGVIQPNEDASIKVIDENKSLTSEDVRDAVSIYAKGYLDIPSMKK